MDQVLDRISLPQRFIQRLDVRGRIKRLPLPFQLLVTFFFSQLLALSIGLPDLLPLLDEVAAGWLFYMSVTATAQTVRERYGDRIRSWRVRRLEDKRAPGALPDLEQAEQQALDPSLIELTLREIEHLDPAVLQEAIGGIRRA